jgi:aryl-alcohol dehydrogenase-like predicted oxidoreductase
MNSNLNLERIALGTAQFGMSYGIANKEGQVSRREVGRIINLAKKIGIRTIDTAMDYGDSELIVGKQNLQNMSIMTKVGYVPFNQKDSSGWLRQHLNRSLDRLNVLSIETLMLHKPQQLLLPSGDEIYRQLLALKAEGLIKQLGISVYNPDELDTILDRYEFCLVQAPYNVFDQRFDHSGWIARLHKMRTKLHVRSIFMQGLLLMPKEKRPLKFQRWQQLWNRWDQWLVESNTTPLAACLHHALANEKIERVLVGVDKSSQLQQIVQAAKVQIPDLPRNLYTNDTLLLNPSKWKHL